MTRRQPKGGGPKRPTVAVAMGRLRQALAVGGSLDIGPDALVVMSEEQLSIGELWQAVMHNNAKPRIGSFSYDQEQDAWRCQIVGVHPDFAICLYVLFPTRVTEPVVMVDIRCP